MDTSWAHSHSQLNKLLNHLNIPLHLLVRNPNFAARNQLLNNKKVQMKNYETVFILNPVLSEEQMKDTVQKFTKILKDTGANIINEELWGLKKLAYPIQHKSTGFYNLVEYEAAPDSISTLETEFRRDEKVMRFLTVSLDKHAIIYNERRKQGAFNKKKKETKEEAKA